MDIQSSTGTRKSANGDENKANLPWVEKYRPVTFDDIVSQDDILTTIDQFIKNERLPHLLFYGPPGTGKTTTIMAVARRLYGNAHSNMVLDLNASDDRGIDVVRDQIKNFAGTQKLFSTGVKLIILDEADNMTNTAQFALRRIIEQYSQNTRFCLICNYVSEIIPAIQSRCTRFRFQPLSPSLIEERVTRIMKSENLTYTEDGLQALLSLTHGDMRRAINLLQSTAMASSVINGENVYLCAGSPSVSEIVNLLNVLMNKSFKEGLAEFDRLRSSRQIWLADIISELVNQIQAISFPPVVQAYLYKELADIEYQLTAGTQEYLQICALIGIFINVRKMIEKSSL